MKVLQGNVRVARTVRAACVAALLAGLAASSKKCFALVASPPHTLAGLLVNQILAASLARPRKNDLLLIESVVGHNWRILLVSLNDSSLLLATSNDLGFGALRRIARAFRAADVLAVGTLLCGGKVGVALVATATDSHAAVAAFC